MAQVEMPVVAAGKSFGRYNCLRLQVKFSADIVYMRLPKVNRGNLPAAPQVINPRMTLRHYYNVVSNSYYIVCLWTRKFWHARSVNIISAFMNKQYSNCFSQREIILADHFYTLLQLFSSCKTSCFFSSPFRHAIKVQVCRNSAWTNFSLQELRWFFISCIARSGIPVD